MTQRSTHVATDPVVGIILHNRGTMRVFRNDRGRLHVEVVGFDTAAGHRFLAELGAQLEDICAEVLVCDDPLGYGCVDGMPPRLHRRRAVAGAGAGTQTGAPTGAPAAAP